MVIAGAATVVSDERVMVVAGIVYVPGVGHTVTKAVGATGAASAEDDSTGEAGAAAEEASTEEAGAAGAAGADEDSADEDDATGVAGCAADEAPVGTTVIVVY